MTSEIMQLLQTLPKLEERSDLVSNQLADLEQLALHLGMVGAAHYLGGLLPQIIEFEQRYGPKKLHPEQRSGEVLLLNMEVAAARYVGWNTKRIGEIAYDWNGVTMPNKVPVFVSAAELESKGQLTNQHTVKL